MSDSTGKSPLDVLRAEFYKEQRDNNKWWFTTAVSFGSFVIVACGVVTYCVNLLQTIPTK